MKLFIDNKLVDAKDFGIVDYYPTYFEDGKIIIFVKGKRVKKAKLDFENVETDEWKRIKELKGAKE